MIMLEMQLHLLTQVLSEDWVNESSVGLQASPTSYGIKRVLNSLKSGVSGVSPTQLEWQSCTSFWSLVYEERHFLSKHRFWEAL